MFARCLGKAVHSSLSSREKENAHRQGDRDGADTGNGGMHQERVRLCGELSWLVLSSYKPQLLNVSFNYLIKSPRHLVQYLACNLLPNGYRYYCTRWLQEDTDPLIVDANLILRYGCHFHKVKMMRRRNGGLASVRYVRCGRLCLLLATDGQSEFFSMEGWRDAVTDPLCVAGYALRINKDTGKVSCRIHRKAQKQVRREFLANVKQDLGWWESKIRAFPFLAFAGVRDNLFHELRELNYARKLLRLPPIDWRRCVKKRFKVEPVFLPTPQEIADLLAYEKKKGKQSIHPLPAP